MNVYNIYMGIDTELQYLDNKMSIKLEYHNGTRATTIRRLIDKSSASKNESMNYSNFSSKDAKHLMTPSSYIIENVLIFWFGLLVWQNQDVTLGSRIL